MSRGGKMIDFLHTFDNLEKSKISNKEVEQQSDEILNLLKTKKQTYAVNKFVLERTITKLQDTII